MSEKLRKYVHVRQDGNSIYYKGSGLEIDTESRLATITRTSSDGDTATVAVIFLASSESVGEWFSPEEKEKK
jgi:hypothetical protein